MLFIYMQLMNENLIASSVCSTISESIPKSSRIIVSTS